MLAETCIAIAISWVLAAWAVPSFDDWRVRQQVRVAARALARALSLARSEAVTRQMRVTVCRSDGKGGCVLPGRRCATGAQDWSCGWLVQAEPGGAARAIVLHWQPPLKDVMITGSATSMTCRGATIVDAAIASVLAAVVIAGAGAARQAMLRAEHALLSRVRAALIVDSTIELMRAGQSRSVALALASRDASRQLPGGAATLARDPDGVHVLTVGWSELEAGAHPHLATCPGMPAPPPGYMRRCISIGFLG
ncbi:hypothetical protein DFQ28_004411 [Apophysomyces sp. BC1034]|nr:hypothetical protein DFQ28_004411 [Apophysomyces sp. BC1034]